jgi:CheY-like chemotaxis protein
VNTPKQNRILVADDSATDRLVLVAMLRQMDFDVVEVADGLAAISAFKECAPDLVLMDALMPVMDGFAAAREIKRLADNNYVPIIFMTALDSDEEFAHCIAAGGDDFLVKPYNRILLRAKLDAFLRQITMHRTIISQLDQIRENNNHLLHEQEVAKRIFDKIVKPGSLSLANIRYRLSPLSIFNGDVALAATSPSQNIIMLLGDFTGHGLAAAIGALPLTQIFYGMVGKGFSLEEILKELNTRLHEVLPVGVFCCLGAVELDIERNTVQVWNGGLPSGVLYRHKSRELVSLVSRHMALGILPANRFAAHVESYAVEPGDRILFWTDGLLEAANSDGEMYGEDRVFDSLKLTENPNQLFDTLNDGVDGFLAGEIPEDDISIVELVVVDRSVLAAIAEPFAQKAAQGPVAWSMNYHLLPDSLRNFNPLPLCLHILMEVPALRSYAGRLYTVMAELYSNALDHGVLKLSSALKSTPNGFAEYYQLRNERLMALTEGFITLHFAYAGNDEGGKLTIEIVDSGSGFAFDAVLSDAPAGAAKLSGRGLVLLQQICTRLEYLGNGNHVRVEFDWHI